MSGIPKGGNRARTPPTCSCDGVYPVASLLTYRLGFSLMRLVLDAFPAGACNPNNMN